MISPESFDHQRELDLLELQVLNVINGQGSIVHLIGQGGTGKTRLIEALRNKDCMKRVTLLEWEAEPSRSTLGIDLLKKCIEIRAEVGQADTFEKLDEATLTPNEVSEILSRAAQRQPLLIVLENLHYADNDTADLVEHLFELVKKDRLLFLNTFRPKSEHEWRLPKMARQAYGSRYVEILLDPVDKTGERSR